MPSPARSPTSRSSRTCAGSCALTSLRAAGLSSMAMVAAPSYAPAIRVDGVVKRFGETYALAGVDLEISAGTVFGMLGPNGAGKTTLVRILSTLLTPDSGRAEILGHDVVAEALAVREVLRLTGQFAAVDEILTGRENL